VVTPTERNEQRKQERRREFDRPVEAGSLVVRQMTPEKREKYTGSPHAAHERPALRAIAPELLGLALYACKTRGDGLQTEGRTLDVRIGDSAHEQPAR